MCNKYFKSIEFQFIALGPRSFFRRSFCLVAASLTMPRKTVAEWKVLSSHRTMEYVLAGYVRNSDINRIGCSEFAWDALINLIISSHVEYVPFQSSRNVSSPLGYIKPLGIYQAPWDMFQAVALRSISHSMSPNFFNKPYNAQDKTPVLTPVKRKAAIVNVMKTIMVAKKCSLFWSWILYVQIFGLVESSSSLVRNVLNRLLYFSCA